jgi:uncharacterized protein
MEPRQLLAEIHAALDLRYGNRLHRVLLFGSLARGDETPDSDIDLLVVLSAPVDHSDETRGVIDVIYPLLQARDVFRPLHVVVAETRAYEGGTIALYRNVQREGIAA